MAHDAISSTINGTSVATANKPARVATTATKVVKAIPDTITLCTNCILMTRKTHTCRRAIIEQRRNIQHDHELEPEARQE